MAAAFPRCHSDPKPSVVLLGFGFVPGGVSCFVMTSTPTDDKSKIHSSLPGEMYGWQRIGFEMDIPGFWVSVLMFVRRFAGSDT